MIRQAGIKDIDLIIRHGRAFFDMSPWAYRSEYNEGDLKKSLAAIISGEGAIFVSETGICGGLIFPLYFNFAHKIAQELFWYSDGDGRSLRSAFEGWAKDNGATEILMTCLANEREAGMRRLLRRDGYKEIEISLVRAV